METQNWLLKQAETIPDHLAVTDGDQKYTFSQLKSKVELLAGKLNSLDPGTKVGILATNTMLSYLLALTVLASGRTIVWLNWRLADDELLRQVHDSQLKLCLVEDSLWRSTMDKHFCHDSNFLQIQAEPASLVQIFPADQVASIMYTSGTTGNPKGVLQTFGNHFYSAISSALNLGVRPDDEWLCVAPIFHISGFSIMMRGLIYGMTVRLTAKFRVSAIERILVNEPISIISVVPFMLQQLMYQQHVSGLRYNPHFRCMLLGGGTTDPTTLAKCQRHHIPVVQCYGMTETCSQIVALRAVDAATKLGSVGQPLFTTQLKLAANGEILLKTPALTPGYLNQPGRLAEKKVDGWYKTGDVGHFDKDHYLYIDGRLDEMMISGGENIFPQEVEQAYRSYPGISEIAVVGKDDPKWGQVPVAFVVSQNALNMRQLVAFGRKHLAHYKVPRQFIKVESLPKNASGKIRRFLLKKKL